MTNTCFEVVGASVITVIAVLGKWIENCAHLFQARAAGKNLHGTVGLHYECWNFHLHLSLGMLGLAWSQHWDSSMCVVLVAFIVLGVVTKGICAGLTPGTLSFFDRDAFLGLYFPNTLAFVCVALVLYGKPLVAATEGDAKGGLPSPPPAVMAKVVASGKDGVVDSVKPKEVGN